MAKILSFFDRKKPAPAAASSSAIASFIDGFSIEVMPRTAEKIEDFRAILPKGTRVYIAHIEGTPIEDMVATAKRINGEGFDVMPHFPARIIKDQATLADWIARYQGEANVEQALLLAGGVTTPHGDFSDSMQLLSTGEFDKAQEPEVDRAAIDFRDMALRHAGPDTDVALAQPYGFPCRAQTLGDMFSRVCHLIFFPISEFNLDMFYLIIPLFRDSRHITGTETVQMPPRRRPPRSRASGPV